VFFTTQDPLRSDAGASALPATALDRLTPGDPDLPLALAITGNEWKPGLLLGVGLVAIGGAAVVASDRRRRHFARLDEG
jgi:hypothetical protein